MVVSKGLGQRVKWGVTVQWHKVLVMQDELALENFLQYCVCSNSNVLYT